MDEKKLEEALNNERNSEIDEDFHSFFEDTVNSLPDKKKFKKRKFAKIAVAGLVAIVISSGATTYGSEILKNIFGVKEVLNDKNTADLYTKYTKDDAINIEIGEYNVTVNNIGYDGSFIVYAYSVERKDGGELEGNGFMGITVGLDIKQSIPKEIKGGYSGSDVDTKIEDNRFSTVVWNDVGKLKLPDIIKGELVVTNHNSSIKKEEKVKIEFAKSKDAIVNTVILDKEIKVDEGSIYLDKIVFSPFAATFHSENRGEFGNHNREEKDPYYYAIFDETGKQIWMGNTSKDWSYDPDTVTKITKTILPQEYIGHSKFIVKVYDSRTSKEIENSAVTIEVPEVK
ncbi:DUF4179 domain-containing protein [Clostridium gasigenes]|uniref:DUF4179 domain-containing protein n=1 Tax=Clostridium gasigenes TaxID=94869 RepID=A0A1H0W0S4_9CLOT|nr:DUF4179 domain-containing protein [Clostridium gasigenes]MBB6714906.1 DUF4179 domain-containing protein [Clostridium gasigenes]SDP83986.1 protein of unknown function [Clostridium gasigenes]